MTTLSRALVLSGGGNAGATWMAESSANSSGWAPLPLDDYLQAKLDAEIKALGPATVHVVLADEESLAAIGPDALSAAAARAALDAGVARAHREITALQAIWPSPTDPAA
jgi:hypothetical protein